jgi:hypothetical protein
MIFNERLPFPVKAHVRHAPSAAGLHAVDVDQEYLAGAGEEREVRDQRVPFRILRQHGPPAPVDAEDERRAIKGTEHDRDAAVGIEMCLRFIARSAEIEIADLRRAEYAKDVHPLRAEVDPRAVRSGGDEEDGLLADEADVIIGESGEEFGHVQLPSGERHRHKDTPRAFNIVPQRRAGDETVAGVKRASRGEGRS